MAQSGYTPILIYASGTASAVPSGSNMTSSASGAELALNYADGKLYYKNSGGTVTLLASAAGASGDVVGPSSATDNALARFDTTTGKLIQNSVGILSDAGVLTGLTGLTSSGNITLSALTSTRIPYASTGGLLVDSANLTFNGTTLTAGGLTTTGTTSTGVLSVTGNTTLGDASADTVTVNGTITSNLIFTDNTYDIGASGATRPRTGYFGTSVITPSLTVSGLTSGRVPYVSTGGLLTDSANLTYTGLQLTNSTNSNSGTYIVNRNVSTGTNATAYFNSDVTAAFSGYASFGSRSTGYTTSGMLEANSGGVFTSGLANGLNIMTLDGYPVKFGVGNTEYARMITGGYFLVGPGLTTTIGFNEQMIVSSPATVGQFAVNSQATYNSSISHYVNKVAQWYSQALGDATQAYRLYNAVAGSEALRVTQQNNFYIGATAGLGANTFGGLYTQAASYVYAGQVTELLGYWMSTASDGNGSGGVGIQYYRVPRGGGIQTGTEIRFYTGYSYTPSTTQQVGKFDQNGNFSINIGILDMTNGISYNSSADRSIYMGANNDQSVNNNCAYQWYMNVGGSATGQLLRFYKVARGLANAEVAQFDTNGNWRVGINSPTINLYTQVNHATGSANGASFFVSSYNGTQIGDIAQSTTSSVVYNTTSDYRLKNNPQPLTGSGDFIDALKPKTWTWATDGSKGAGFIAHEFAEVSPTSVTGEKDAVDENGNPKYQGMQASTAEVIANLVAEIQLLRQRLAAANL